MEKQPKFMFKRSIDVRVRQVHAIGVPRCLVAIESELCSNLQQSDAVDEDPYPQLRPLKISQNGCGAAKFLFQGADRCNPRRMIGMVAMAHIDAESIGSGKIKFADHLRAIAGRTQRCQYFDLARDRKSTRLNS